MKSKIILAILIVIICGAFKFNAAQDDSEYINISNTSHSKTFEGFIKHRTSDKLCFKSSGKISFLPYSKGDYIKKGEVLARLDGLSYKIKKEALNINNEANYNIIVAPYDGYIEKILVPLNSYVKNNEPVFELYETNKTQAEAMVDAEYINKINLNKKAILEYKNSQYEAKISNITKNDNCYLIGFELDNLYKELKEGTSINIKLELNP